MIYAKSLNLAFIRVPKTGSVSVAKFFVDNILVEGDLISFFSLDPKTNISYAPAEPFNFPMDGETYRDENGQKVWQHFDNSHMDMEYVISEGLITGNPRIIAVVRNPFEKLLSLYFARLHSVFKVPNVHDFRRAVKTNWRATTEARHLIGDWQRQHQWTFLRFNGEEVGGEWWCFDYLAQHMNQLVSDYSINVKVPFDHHNRSVEGVNTKDFIDRFYDQETKDFVLNEYAPDIELYKRTKDKYQDLAGENHGSLYTTEHGPRGHVQ